MLTPAAMQQAEAVVEGVGVVMEYGFGGFFGELALRTSAPRAATVRAKVSESHCRHDAWSIVSPTYLPGRNGALTRRARCRCFLAYRGSHPRCSSFHGRRSSG